MPDLIFYLVTLEMKNQHFNTQVLTRVEGSPLLGGRGAFVMGKANYRRKTAFVIWE